MVHLSLAVSCSICNVDGNVSNTVTPKAISTIVLHGNIAVLTLHGVITKSISSGFNGRFNFI